MSSPSEIGGSNQNKSEIVENQLVKVKLRINIVIVSREKGKQEKLASQFRDGKIDDIQLQDELADELAAGTVSYVDEDEGEYVCYDKTLVADETSPRAMQAMSIAIDNYIKSYCINPDVSEVVVCLLLPSISPDGKVPLAFLNTYWIPSIQKMVAMPKIAIQKSVILLYGIQKIIKKSMSVAVDVADWGAEVVTDTAKKMVDVATDIKDSVIDKVEKTKDTIAETVGKAKDIAGDVVEKTKDTITDTVEKAKDIAGDVVEKAKDTATDMRRKTVELIDSCKPKDVMTETESQIAALMSYYVYFYLDLYENDNWRFFKKNRMYDTNNIEKYAKKRAEEKYTPKPDDVWGRTINFIKFVRSIGEFPVNTVTNFLFGYGANLEKRIYSRIADVYDVTINDKVNEKKEVYVKELSGIIKKVLEIETKSSGKKDIVNLYDFYDRCGYWSYLGNETIKKECYKWCYNEDKKEKLIPEAFAGFVSGFGGMLFKDAEGNGVFVFKGTDFDSLVRDWLLANILQGLTGSSLQYMDAEKYAKQYDKQFTGDKKLFFAGHSLGGGLASAAVLATSNRTGVTFNAAGLNVIGSKITQLYSNPLRTIFPYKDWLRVTPYRIRGEFLDRFQQILGWSGVPILERGYGLNAVELDITDKDFGIERSCGEKHGIINFLYKQVLNSLKTYSSTESIERKGPHNINTKIKVIDMKGKSTDTQTKIG